MSDLSSLYNNGAGSMASLFAGQNQAAQQDQQQQELIKMRMANEQAQVMNPLEAQFKQGQLQQQQAQLPGIMGQSQSAAAQGQFDTQTLTAKIAKSVADTKVHLNDTQIRGMQQDGEKIRQLAGIMKQYPPALHKQLMESYMSKVEGGQEMIKQFGNVSPDKLQQLLEASGNAIALATADHVQKTDMKRQENESQERNNMRTNDARLAAAELAAQARVKAAETRMQAMQDLASVEKLIGQLVMKGSGRTPEETKKLQDLQSYQLTLKAAAAPATTANVLEQDSPMIAAQKAAQQLTPSEAPKPKEQGGGEVESLAKKAGWAYEPTKYMYRVQNGKLQRALK